MKLGGRTFAVPRLPLQATIRAYPLCRKLRNSDVLGRFTEISPGEFTEEDMRDLAEVAFICAQAADWSFPRAEFDQLSITPGELVDAFMLVAIFQTGGWFEIAGAPDQSGEGEGAARPPKSTSTESSPA